MSALVDGCLPTLSQTGCGCIWQDEKSKAPLQGLVKAGSPKVQDADKCPASSDPDFAECAAASVSAAACEAWCCHGLDGNGPPIVTSAPSEPLKPATGPCGAWQWAPGDVNGGVGCWVGVEPALQKLPHNDGGGGAWMGAEGNLGQRGDWGWTFLLVTCVAGCIYVALFGVLNFQSGKRGATNLLPHRQVWAELMAMVSDGVQFSAGSIRGGPSQRSAGQLDRSASGKNSKKKAEKQSEVSVQRRSECAVSLT
jgi:hypothetical protein